MSFSGLETPPPLGVAHELSCPAACGILVPLPGIEPVSPAFQGWFLTTGPPGKSSPLNFFSFPGGSVGKNSPATQKMWVRSLGQEDPLEKKMATHARFLPGKSHEQRSLGAPVCGAARGRQDWATKPPPPALEAGSLPFPSKTFWRV